MPRSLPVILLVLTPLALSSAALARAAPRQAPVGVPVTGGADRESAPVLKPGAHLDAMPPGPDVERHYAFDLPDGATAFLVGQTQITEGPGPCAAADRRALGGAQLNVSSSILARAPPPPPPPAPLRPPRR
ncbi:hypothetical protein [Nonomuraea fuscirosea]|uniref:hypothetical protein n=1 Tax=Nonomuraea fuscirosea TaxID=1291556 RepID=UPI003436A203